MLKSFENRENSLENVNIVIEGCCHGELDTIYNSVEKISREQNVKIDLLIICGDFQSVRNEQDLACLACPPKYRAMNTFYKYYSGEKRAPVLTLFVGGNHEASNYLAELPFGGWVAPRIYYMGWAGVVKFCGLTIAGISGIYKGGDFQRNHHEFPPYDSHALRTAYHVRSLEVYRLMQYDGNVDIFFSHDWPLGIHDFGNTKELLRRKRFLADDISKNELGSEANLALLKALKPSYYFAAHLHAKFAAVFPHEGENPQSQIPTVDNTINGTRVTRFLALDKVLPARPFLQYLSLPCSEPKLPESTVLKHDLEWLTILKATDDLLSVYPSSAQLPRQPLDDSDFWKAFESIREAFTSSEDLVISENFFQVTVPPYNPRENPQVRLNVPQPPLENNQYTEWLCSKLKIKNPIVEFFKLIESGTIALKQHAGRGGDFESSNHSFMNNTFMSTPGSFRGRNSFFGSDLLSHICPTRDPNEVELRGSSDGDSGDNEPPDGAEDFFMESFSKTSLPAADESEVLKSLNSTLEESRSDPSALDISVINSEPRSKISTGDLSMLGNSVSAPVMQSTPLGAKTFKRRNTLDRSETS